MSPQPIPAQNGPWSLTDFQQAHAALDADATGADVLAGDFPTRIVALVRGGAALGTRLDDPDDRASVQALINYWAAELSSAAREAQREAERLALTGEPVGLPPPEAPDLGDTLLAEFDGPGTFGRAIAAADAWMANLSPLDRATAHRLLLRLVRLRANERVFDVMPTIRAALRDLEAPTGAPEVSNGATAVAPRPIDDLIQQLEDAGIVRVLANTSLRPSTNPGAQKLEDAGDAQVGNEESPEADRIVLRSAELITGWPTLAQLLNERIAFRQRVEEWVHRTAGPAPALAGRCRGYIRSAGRWAVNALDRIGDKFQSLVARLRRAVALPSPSESDLMTEGALDEARAYHDRNAAERQFVVVSRYQELEGHKRSRVLAGVFAVAAGAFAVLGAFAVTGWLLAAFARDDALVQKGEALVQKEIADRARDDAKQKQTVAEDRGRLILIQRDARRMQAAAESTSSLALSLMLMTELEGLSHSAKKMLIIQSLGHVLFSQSKSEAEIGRANWRLFAKQISAPEAPNGGWFDAFLNQVHDGAIQRITSGEPASRGTVRDLLDISHQLRSYILHPFVEDKKKAEAAAASVAAAFGAVRGVAFKQLAQVTDRIVEKAETREPLQSIKDIRGFRNVYWRLYTCEVVLLQGDAPDDPLKRATDAFAEALWAWEESPDGYASPATVEKLKVARDKVRAACAPPGGN